MTYHTRQGRQCSARISVSAHWQDYNVCISSQVSAMFVHIILESVGLGVERRRISGHHRQWVIEIRCIMNESYCLKGTCNFGNCQSILIRLAMNNCVGAKFIFVGSSSSSNHIIPFDFQEDNSFFCCLKPIVTQ